MSPFWNKQPDSAPLISQAEAALNQWQQIEKEIKEVKNDKLQRQAELWSISTLDHNQDAEYRKVAAELTLLEKKLLRLEEARKPLQLALYHCKEGKCEELQALLPVGDPFAGLDTAIPKVEFTLSPETGGALQRSSV